MRKRTISEKLIRTVYLLFALLCIGMLGAALLYVFVHGREQGVWELRYAADMAVAAAAFCLFRLLNRRIDGKEKEETKRICRVTAAAVCCVCLTVHFLSVQQLRIQPRGDAGKFFRAAEDLANGNELRNIELLALFPHILGYANFLSVFFRLFRSTSVAPVVNVLLSTLGVLLLFRTVQRSGAFRPCRSGDAETVSAMRAALVWALLPSAVLYDSLVLSEPLYTVLVLLFALLMTDFTEGARSDRGLLPTVGAGALIGVLLSAIHAVRTVSSILLVALVIWLVLRRRSDPENRKNRRGSVTLLCFLLVTVCVYAAGNRLWTSTVENQLGEEPAGFPWYNMLTGFNEEVSGTHSEEDVQILYAAMGEPGGTARGAQELMRELLKERLRSGINFPRLYAEKLKLFAGNDETAIGLTAEPMSESAIELMQHLCNIAYYQLVIAAIAGGIRKAKSAESGVSLLAALYVLGLTLAHVLLFEVSGRYHYSMLPMLAIVAYGKE